MIYDGYIKQSYEIGFDLLEYVVDQSPATASHRVRAALWVDGCCYAGRADINYADLDRIGHGYRIGSIGVQNLLAERKRQAAEAAWAAYDIMRHARSLGEILG